MGRRKKPSGRLSSGPWTYKDLAEALGRDGWYEVEHGSHPNFEHPTKPGKVQLDKKWDGVKKGSVVYNGVARQAGLKSKELQKLLNS